MKGIIFDMDGTMVDNMMVHHRAWQKKLSDLGLDMDLEEVRQKVHGINVEILEKLFGDRFNLEERRRISREKEIEYQRIFKPDLKLIAGLPAFLQKLKDQNIPLAIGSAAPPENVDFVLDNLNIRSDFKFIMHSEDVTLGKPNPEIYLKLSAKLGLAPEDCVVFEDTPAGAGAAMNAGCPMIIVTTTHEPEEFAKFKGIQKFIGNYEAITIEQGILS